QRLNRLEAEAALSAGRLDQAAASWHAFAWPGRGAASPVEAADFGARLLEAAAERGDGAVYRAVREPLRQWTGRVGDEEARGALLRRAALVDARRGDWDAFHALLGDDSDPALLEGAAIAEARQGDAAAARRMLDLAGERTVSRAPWHVARAGGADREGEPADVLVRIFDLPDAASRCAAFLGVPLGLDGR